jgi:hypothetical protein
VKKDFRIVVTGSSVSLRRLKDDARVWETRWADVKEIVAWKDDVWSNDIICMGFRLEDAARYVWCDEECDGWGELLKKVEQIIGKPDTWWSKVAFPAFETKWTTIWGEPPADSSIELLPRS